MNFEITCFDNILTSLEECFDIKNKQRLKQVYSVFRKNFYLEGDEPKVEDGTLVRNDLLLRNFNNDLFFDHSYWLGIDIPVLLTENNSSKLAVLISEDPFRNENDIHLIPHKNNIILSTPFGVHLSNIINKNGKASHKLFVNFIIKPLLEKGYNVYSTDVFKLWMKRENALTKIDFTSDNMIYSNFLNCLQREIYYLKEKYNPQEIKFIAVGNKAYRAFNKIKEFNKPYKILHPAARDKHFKIKTRSETLKVSKVEYYQNKIREIIN